jgi:hypothetical protein
MELNREKIEQQGDLQDQNKRPEKRKQKRHEITVIFNDRYGMKRFQLFERNQNAMIYPDF